MTTLALDIVTPEKQLFSKAVDMVVVPGTEGDFGVLDGHSPLISNIRPGVIRAYKNDKVTDRILVIGGVAEVTGDRCTILSAHAYNFADISKKDIEERLAAIKKIHDDAVHEKERLAAQSEMEVFQKALDAFVTELDQSN